MNMIKKILILMFAMILLVGIVSAMGVAFPNPLKIAPGETVERFLSLQNSPAGEGDLTFVGIIEEGSEVFSFTAGNEFEVKDGQVVNAPIMIQVPQDAKLGDSYLVKILFKTSASESTGETVQFNSGTKISFNVIVAEESSQSSVMPEEGIAVYWLLIIGIITLALVILAVLLFLKRRK